VPHYGTVIKRGYGLGLTVSLLNRVQTKADLFAVLSTTYNAGDGSTTFGTPDLRGVVLDFGKNDMGGAVRCCSNYCA
jgi:microcystin-dependent protein